MRLGSTASDTSVPSTINEGLPDGGVADVFTYESHTIVRMKSGELYSFGENRNGQLAHSEGSNYQIPMMIPDFTGGNAVVDVAVGEGFSVAVDSVTKAIYTWGDGINLGDGTARNRTAPTQIAVGS
jgi:alpha-tubulin suppressor-like RCC1 family protein